MKIYSSLIKSILLSIFCCFFLNSMHLDEATLRITDDLIVFLLTLPRSYTQQNGSSNQQINYDRAKNLLRKRKVKISSDEDIRVKSIKQSEE